MSCPGNNQVANIMVIKQKGPTPAAPAHTAMRLPAFIWPLAPRAPLQMSPQTSNAAVNNSSSSRSSNGHGQVGSYLQQTANWPCNMTSERRQCRRIERICWLQHPAILSPHSHPWPSPLRVALGTCERPICMCAICASRLQLFVIVLNLQYQKLCPGSVTCRYGRLAQILYQ